MLLATASLAFGAPLLLNSSPAQTSSVKSDSGPSDGSTDGFQLTVQAFRQRVKKGHEIVEFLQKINAEAKAGAPGNPSKQQAYLLMKLNESYPGSTYDGNKGSVLFQKNFTASFNNTMNVEAITEQGEVSATYLLPQSQIIISFGVNSVTAVIDGSTPSRSRFTNVVLPAVRFDAENILSIPGYKRITADSMETSILNDAYQLLSQTNALRMDYFAADVMRSAKLQKKALSIAASGYFERHPLEYQKGAEQKSVVSKRGEDGASLSHGKATQFLGTLLAVVLFALGLFQGFRRLLGFLQMLFLDDSAKKYVKQYRSLSPMVIRSLRQVGRSLWGRNYPWNRKFYLTKRSDRWVLSDRKIDRYDLNCTPDNLLEVCLRGDNLKIRVTRIKGVTVDIAVISSGYTRAELMGHLREVSSAFTQEESSSG